MKLGLFMLGLLHTKASASYAHIIELVADKDKSLSISLLNAFSCSAYFWIGLYYQFVDPNTDNFTHFYFVVGASCCLLYLLVTPESPQWLIMKNGNNCQKAIANLNYIAAFNGSPNRISHDTYFKTSSKHTVTPSMENDKQESKLP